MAGNTFGHLFRLTTFGESHGEAIGGVIDGCPAGIALDFEEIKEKQDSGELKSEIFWRLLQFEELLFIRAMGGSEAYPIEKLDPMIEEEKQFIAKHIDKALF